MVKDHVKSPEFPNEITQSHIEASVCTKSSQNGFSFSDFFYDNQPLPNSLNHNIKNSAGNLNIDQKVMKTVQGDYNVSKTSDNSDYKKNINLKDYILEEKNDSPNKYNVLMSKLSKSEISSTDRSYLNSSDEIDTRDLLYYATKYKKFDAQKKNVKPNFMFQFTRPICSTCGGANKTSTSTEPPNSVENNQLDSNDLINLSKTVEDKGSDSKISSTPKCLTCGGANKSSSTESTTNFFGHSDKDKFYGHNHRLIGSLFDVVPKRNSKLVKTQKRKTVSERQHNYNDYNDFIFLKRREENKGNKSALWQRIKSKYVNRMNKKYNERLNEDNNFDHYLSQYPLIHANDNYFTDYNVLKKCFSD